MMSLDFSKYVLEGIELPIFTYPDPVLTLKAKPITNFNDSSLIELTKNMLYTMYVAPGIGLAAPQIGKSIRLIVVDVDYSRTLLDENGKPKLVKSSEDIAEEEFETTKGSRRTKTAKEEEHKRISTLTSKLRVENKPYQYDFLSPRLFINPEIVSFEGKTICKEGCLSLPEVYEDVERHEKIELKYFDILGKEQRLFADDMLAICLQHEMDHLDGVVLIDRLSQLKRSFLKKKLQKIKKIELQDKADSLREE